MIGGRLLWHDSRGVTTYSRNAGVGPPTEDYNGHEQNYQRLPVVWESESEWGTVFCGMGQGLHSQVGRWTGNPESLMAQHSHAS
jgi:hypothetical protein